MPNITDEILVVYNADIGQFEQKINRVVTSVTAAGEAGEQAFEDIGNAAQGATPKIANVGKVAEKAKSQFNGLGNSINQLTRELPAFTMNLNTGFLAISNNLPALFDAINNIKAVNRDLAAQGKQTQTVLAQVATALFSWQTALSIGVTLLTAYGGKIIGFITGQEDSADATKKAETVLKKYNDQLKINRILQNTFSATVKNELAQLDKLTSSQEKVVSLQTVDAKHKQEMIDLTEREEQSVQELFKAYDVNYTDYLQLQKAMADPSIAAALGETRMKQLRGEASALDKFLAETGISDFTPLINTSKEFNQKLNNLQASFEEERNSLSKKQTEEYFDMVESSNKKIIEDELDVLRRRVKIMEAAGQDTYNIQLDIYARELKLFDSVTEDYKDKIAERDAFIAKHEKESRDKRQALLDSANEAFLKSQEEIRHQAGAELDKISADYFAQKDKEKKAEEDALKQKGELWMDEVKLWRNSRELKKAALTEELNFSQTAFSRQSEILKEMLDKNFITQYEYTEATIQLENAKRTSALNTISAVADALGSFANILGQNTEAGKGLAIAQATIDTYVAAQKAYLSQLQFDPSAPIRATIAAAAAVASGLARVAQIARVNVPKPQVSRGVSNSAGSQASSPFEQAPGFREGVVDLNGPGTGTSDSIVARISRGESVITATSTYAKKDELTALNKSIPDYEALLYKKYVKPAIDAEAEKQNIFAANIAKSIALYAGFNDARIVKAIEKNKPATSKDIQQLTDAIAKRERTEKFESKLRQSKHGR